MRSRTAAPRDHALDVIRGVCIVMMTFGHLAPGTVPTRVLHPAPWVDGASGFVLLSGLVLGMVQRGRLARGGLAGAEKALARRIGVLYAAHVCITSLALVVGTAGWAEASWLPDAAHEGGVGSAVVKALLLQVNPPYLNILSLYVVLLALAMLALPLLVRGHVKTLCAASVALYAVAQLAPAATTLPGTDGNPGYFAWGAWQLLFLSGFVAGYYWKSADLARRLRSPRVVATAVCSAAVIYAVCLPVVYLDVWPAAHGVAVRFVEKTTAGPGAIILAWVAFVVAYWVLGTIRSGGLDRLSALSAIGRRSLDCYIVLSLLVILVPAATGRIVVGTPAIVLAVVALAAMRTWVAIRDRVARRAGPQASPDRGDADAAVPLPETEGRAGYTGG